MTNIKFRGVAKDTSLTDLNTIVAQREAILGPLVVMGHSADDPTTPGDETLTVLGFDLALPRPAKHAIIQKTADPAPASATKVCQGTVYVSGDLTDCTAYRAN